MSVLQSHRLDLSKIPSLPTASTFGTAFLTLKCAIACSRLRSDARDVAACNSFYMDTADCHAGYADPNDVVDAEFESADQAAAEAMLYTDF